MESNIALLKKEIKKKQIPKHIAIIMDGNGRWASKQGLNRSKGHEAGTQTVSDMLDTCLELEIPYISLYSFSTENWLRPKTEIFALFHLIDHYIENKLTEIIKKNVRIMVSGDITPLPKKTKELLKHAIQVSKKNKVLIANFCINYGGQAEMLNVCSKIIESRINKLKQINLLNIDNLNKKITKKEFEKFLYTYPLPPVDLMIRTAGEQRLSNFLLYQNAYAELYFSNVLWPDFNKEEAYKSIITFQNRKRTFGDL